ncbi:FeoA family protein [Paenibacillus aquistagni]|uniref:Ferrous iron transport protein A n=1 Tax=Paenibacillus aquistagni TaxID=1852522 RepID=A0A1X7JX46_9BACL|nr:FeoA family protein [Paenibacillus aquistagni]NMM54893.1 ferrous iron transport protein A [Paenibacillus aquistagni]SMG32675.1 ferrous iron transport protein A [Paenibacillus aquistagni]
MKPTSAAPSSHKATLHRLKKGKQAHISDMSSIHETVQQRLLDLGVTEGTMIKLIRRSLFGGPLMLEANGQLFGLRRVDASLIGVKPL